MFFGVWIDHFTFPFLGIVDLPTAVGMTLTAIWIVAVMNMVNFLDGLDGLAAGVCAIAGLTYVVLALSLEKIDPAILSAIIAGACIGFLRHNFFPARIFMGDSGALVLGFLLAAVSVQGLLKTASTVVLFLPLLVLAVPILDTSFVVARRLKHGQPVSGADQAHLHFRFLRRGFSQRRAALTMWAWCATLATAALATRFIPFREGGHWHLPETLAAGAIGLVALAFSVYVVYVLEIVKLANPRARRREEAAAASAAPPSRRAREELGESLVEARRALGGVAGAGEDGALGVELALEHVADDVERLVVGARDDELRERRGAQLRERDLGLPRAAFDHQRPRGLLELGRQRRGRVEATTRRLAGRCAGTRRAPSARRARARSRGPRSRRPPGARARPRSRAARSP